jgi:hypothetical protein
MNLNEARKFLNEYGYKLVENDIGVERNIKNLFTKNGWNLEETYERSGGVHIIMTRDGLEMDLFVKGFRYECDIFKGSTKIRTFANDFDNASEIVERVNLEL